MQINRTPLLLNSISSAYHETHIAKKTAGWYGLCEDLKYICSIAHKLHDLITANSLDGLFLESLTWHLVIRYARCFNGSKGRSAGLNDAHVKKLNDPDLLELHNNLKIYRDHVFAHAGVHCFYKAIIHLMPSSDKGQALQVTFESNTPGPNRDLDQIKGIIKLCKGLLKVATDRLEHMKKKLAEEIERDEEKTIAALKAIPEKHANSMQQGLAVLLQIQLRKK